MKKYILAAVALVGLSFLPKFVFAAPIADNTDGNIVTTTSTFTPYSGYADVGSVTPLTTAITGDAPILYGKIYMQGLPAWFADNNPLSSNDWGICSDFGCGADPFWVGTGTPYEAGNYDYMAFAPLTSGDVATGTEMLIFFNDNAVESMDLINGNLGRDDSVSSFDGEGDIVACLTTDPTYSDCGGASSTPVSLFMANQYQPDGMTAIKDGGTLANGTIAFGAEVDAVTSDTLQLQVEVEPTGVSFTGNPTATSSDLASPGSTTTVTVTGLADGSYHWQARVLGNTTGATSTWQAFGSDMDSDVDFKVSNGVFFDTAAGTGAYVAGTSITYPMTIDNPGETIIANSYCGHVPDYDCNAVTYDDLPMTLITSTQDTVQGNWNTMWELTDAPVGTHDLVATYNTGDGGWLSAASYHGIVGIGAMSDFNDTSTDSISGTFSPMATSSWIAIGYRNYEQGMGSGVSPFVARAVDSYQTGFWDSGDTIANAGSDFSVDCAGNNPCEGIMVELLASIPESYYAEIENTSTLAMYAASSTSADVLKTLSTGWVVQVASSTDASGSSMIDGDGNTWFVVTDPSDGTTGWMIASDTTAQYITSYDGIAQPTLQASAAEEGGGGMLDDVVRGGGSFSKVSVLQQPHLTFRMPTSSALSAFVRSSTRAFGASLSRFGTTSSTHE